ncbi:hypothetical protein [Nonomuraea sp. NPDC049646]|uniref:hypothetical protein n=1 Tax=unclassified Nonomuraea TaxID=2593643 RepID=UPI0037A42E9B
MTPTAEPLYVFDAYHPSSRRFYAADMHPRMLAWMREQGLSPAAVWRFEVHLVDCPSVRVWEYLLDGDEVPYCGIEHPHRPRSCVLAEREPYTVVASSLPPILDNSTPNGGLT